MGGEDLDNVAVCNRTRALTRDACAIPMIQDRSPLGFGTVLAENAARDSIPRFICAPWCLWNATELFIAITAPF